MRKSNNQNVQRRMQWGKMRSAEEVEMIGYFMKNEPRNMLTDLNYLERSGILRQVNSAEKELEVAVRDHYGRTVTVERTSAGRSTHLVYNKTNEPLMYAFNFSGSLKDLSDAFPDTVVSRVDIAYTSDAIFSQVQHLDPIF